MFTRSVFPMMHKWFQYVHSGSQPAQYFVNIQFNRQSEKNDSDLSDGEQHSTNDCVNKLRLDCMP